MGVPSWNQGVALPRPKIKPNVHHTRHQQGVSSGKVGVWKAKWRGSSKERPTSSNKGRKWSIHVWLSDYDHMDLIELWSNKSRSLDQDQHDRFKGPLWGLLYRSPLSHHYMALKSPRDCQHDEMKVEQKRKSLLPFSFLSLHPIFFSLTNK